MSILMLILTEIKIKIYKQTLPFLIFPWTLSLSLSLFLSDVVDCGVEMEALIKSRFVLSSTCYAEQSLAWEIVNI